MNEIFNRQWLTLSLEKKQQALKQYLGDLRLYVVYVDVEEDLHESIAHRIEEMGLTAYTTTRANDAINFINQHRNNVVLVLSDYKMPDFSGFDLRLKLCDCAKEIPFAILSGFVDREMALRGLELKIATFLDKPLEDNAFLSLLQKEVGPRLQTIKDDRELLSGFIEDAGNLLEQAEEIILELEENPSDLDAVSRVFGMIHTIKGSSGFFVPKTLHEFAHRFEDLLKQVQNGQAHLSHDLATQMLKALDILKELLGELQSGEHKKHDLNELAKIFSKSNSDSQSPPDSERVDTEPGVSSSRTKGPRELKIAVSLLDEFMQISGEMTVIRNMLNKTVRSIEKSYQGDKDVALLSELLDELHKINGTVQSKMTELRKVPFKNVVKPITRIVRDVSSALSKEVELHVRGDNLRIDNSLAEVLSNSLVHIIRNSLDHGVELPADRMATGKSRKGSIALSCEVRGENIVVEITDDGRGIDLSTITQKLISQGIKTEIQASRMSPQEIMQMIFAPGFSTAKAITDLSGRGVGMSMVKDSVESLGGKILIHSELGKGSKFTLDLPIPKSVLITNCLFVTSGQAQMGIPQDQVSRIIKLHNENRRDLIEHLEGAFVLLQPGKIVPLVHLKEALGGQPHDLSQGEYNIVILKTTKGLEFGLVVEDVLDVEDTVVKTLSGQFKSLGLYMGGTFLGDGTVGLIMNVDGIASRSGLNKEVFVEPEVINEKVAKENSRPVLLFDLDWTGNFGIYQKEIFRIEEVGKNQLQRSGDLTVLPYRDGVMTILDVATLLANEGKFPSHTSEILWPDNLQLIVIKVEKNYVGLHVKRILDMVETVGNPQQALNKSFGLYGTLLIGDSLVSLISPSELTEALYVQPEGSNASPNPKSDADSGVAA